MGPFGGDVLELDEIVNSPCDTPQMIENGLRAYVGFVTGFQG